MSKDYKVRAAKAGVTAVVLCILSLLAGKGEGFDVAEMSISLFFSVLAGIAVWWKGKFPKPVSIAIAAAAPIAALCCMEFYTHVPWDLSIPIFLINLIFYIILYAGFTFLTGSVKRGYAIATVIPMIVGIINYFVVSFRSSPVVPWDLYSIGTAVSVTDNYEFTITYRLVYVILAFAWIIILSSKTQLTITKRKCKLAGFLLSCICMAGYLKGIQMDQISDLVGFDTTLFTPTVLYRNNGFFGAFLSNLKYLNVEEPDGYSVELVEKIEQEIDEKKEQSDDDTEKPNVIVIMNEAFADLSYVADFETSEDYMPNIHSLKENTVKGNLFVSVKGGNTANTEFEFLTGDSCAFLPSGSVAYQQFLHKETPSLASHLKNMGYATTAIHPYYASGWNREKVYQYFEFDQALFLDSFENPEKIREYVSDREAFKKIIEQYESKEKGKPLFLFEVTMQNHGGYSRDYPGFEPTIELTQFPEKTTQIVAVEKYLTLIQKSDEAFGELLDYFEDQKEKTVILMFGDHQPSDYITNPLLNLNGIDRESSLEEFQKGYVVPFVIWANYDIEEETVDKISVNYLSGLLMEKTGLPMSDYHIYLNELRKTIPVLTGNVFIDQNGGYHTLDEKVLQEERDEYASLQYNHLIDTSRRVQSFF